MKKYFWEKGTNEGWEEIFYNKLIENRGDISLEYLYKLFLDIENIDCYDLKCYTNSKNKEKFLKYLEELLKRGELEMKLNFNYESRKCEINGNTYYHFYDGGEEYTSKNYKEGIEKLKNKWFSIKKFDELRALEDLGVQFTLPENELK